MPVHLVGDRFTRSCGFVVNSKQECCFFARLASARGAGIVRVRTTTDNVVRFRKTSTNLLLSVWRHNGTRHARRERTAPHHRDCGARSGEPGFLRRYPGHAARQAQRQPGRSRHLSPLLRGRGRAVPARISRSFRGRTWRRREPAMASPWKSISRSRRAALRIGAIDCSVMAPRSVRRKRDSDRRCCHCTDPHGLNVALVEVSRHASVYALGRQSGSGPSVRSAASTARRCGSARRRPTTQFLTSVLGFQQLASENGLDAIRLRGRGRASSMCATRPKRAAARGASAAVHHLAWRVDDDGHQLAVRTRVEASGRAVRRPVIDRFWFKSVYFKEPGGVLFELATDGPGFAVDEATEHLGESAGAAALARSAARRDRAVHCRRSSFESAAHRT